MVGLFFGDTDLPKQILKKIKQKKIKYLIIDLSKNKIFKNNILVKEVLEFINKDKKRPICTPYSN